MAEETIENARAEKYGHAGSVMKNDPECVENDAEFAGKLVHIFTRHRRSEKTTFFTITCGHPGMKKNEDGRYMRDVITAEFDGAEGDYYAEKFSEGDFVLAKAVAQTLTNVRDRRRSTIFIGQSIEDGKKNVLARDINKVHLTGRVVSAERESDSWVSLLISTRIWKKRFNYMTGQNNMEDLYRSITKVRLYAGLNDAKRVAEQVLTKGTIVSIDGRVYGRRETDPETNSIRHVTTIIANDASVIGDIQPSGVDPVETVFHKENIGDTGENGENPSEAPED